MLTIFRIKDAIVSKWKQLVSLLKENYILPMSDEELIAKIPTDSISFADFAAAVHKMRVGEKQVFHFNPLDRKFAQDRQRLAEYIAIHVHSSYWITFEVKPRKGIYTLTFTKE